MAKSNSVIIGINTLDFDGEVTEFQRLFQSWANLNVTGIALTQIPGVYTPTLENPKISGRRKGIVNTKAALDYLSDLADAIMKVDAELKGRVTNPVLLVPVDLNVLVELFSDIFGSQLLTVPYVTGLISSAMMNMTPSLLLQQGSFKQTGKTFPTSYVQWIWSMSRLDSVVKTNHTLIRDGIFSAATTKSGWSQDKSAPRPSAIPGGIDFGRMMDTGF